MASNETNAFIGVAGLGVGLLIVYATYKNVPIFGPNGIVTKAITTGDFVDISSLPAGFSSAIGGGLQHTTPAYHVTWSDASNEAASKIAAVSPALALQIREKMTKLAGTQGTKEDVDRLYALLAEARKYGLKNVADVIENDARAALSSGAPAVYPEPSDSGVWV